MAIQRTLKLGDHGADVSELQQFLQTIRIDGRPLHDGTHLGRYDETTQYAVTRLQAALIKGGTLEIKEPTGNYGRLTQEAWDKANETVRAVSGIQTGAAPSNPYDAVSDITVTAEKEAPANASSTPKASGYKPSLVGRALNGLGEINIPGIHQGPHSYAIAQQQRYIAEHGVSDAPMRSPHVEDAIITSGYGMRHHPVMGGRRMHAGLDSVALHDRTLVAPVGGFVVRNGGGSGFGENVVIYSDRNEKVILAHLKTGSIPREIDDGARVEAGQVIGVMGSTGRSSGPHLHTEVHKAKALTVIDGKEDFESRAQDPMTLFALTSGKSGHKMLAVNGRNSASPLPEGDTTQSAAALMQSIIKEQGLKPLPAVAVAVRDAEPAEPVRLPIASVDALEPVPVPLGESSPPVDKGKAAAR